MYAHNAPSIIPTRAMLRALESWRDSAPSVWTTHYATGVFHTHYAFTFGDGGGRYYSAFIVGDDGDVTAILDGDTYRGEIVAVDLNILPILFNEWRTTDGSAIVHMPDCTVDLDLPESDDSSDSLYILTHESGELFAVRLHY